MSEYEKVEDYFLDASTDETDISVDDLIAKLQAYKAATPEEVQDTAFVRVRVYGDYSSAYLHFGRRMTQAEIAQDRWQRAQRDAQYQAEAEEKERAQYARLKAKFEGGS
jgi:hypothetical protein